MLAEDEGFGDITSDAVVDNGQEVSAYIVSKDEVIEQYENATRFVTKIEEQIKKEIGQ